MLRRPDSFKPHRITGLFTPDFIASSVLDIDFDYLATQGIKAALIDLDGTVVARNTYDVKPEVRALLKQQPLKVYIATNRPKSRDLKDLKQHLHANGVIHPVGPWGKPFRRYFAQAAHEHGLRPEEIIMIGDRYLQDIFGANRAGFRTLVVRKLDRPTNMLDRLLSGTERRHTDRLSTHYQSLDI
jgi:HAD superfamily phosphatase (TIGR01668 family)